MPRLLAILLLTLSAFPALALNASELYTRLAPSIWVVKTYDHLGMPIVQGSAVVIAPMRLLTNCHVLRKAQQIKIFQKTEKKTARLEYIDVRRDMCQLAVDGEFAAPAVELGDSDAVAVGMRVYTFGAPLGMDLTLSAGAVTALRTDPKGQFFPTLRDDPKAVLIQSDAPISPGSSGGGLFDEQGRLIGITSAYVNGGQNLNLAIPVNWQRDLAERSRVQIAAFRSEDLKESKIAAK